MHELDITIDCRDPERLAGFWAEALRYDRVEALGEWRVLSRRDSSFPKLLLQPVPEPKTVKNRLHLDLVTADVEAEARRLERLGARRAAGGDHCEDGFRWVVMADPEGNEFCVADGP